MTYYLFFLTIWASFMTAYAVKLRHVNRTHQISYSQQRESVTELLEENDKLRQIAMTHEVTPIIIKPVQQITPIIENKMFVAHPSKILELIAPFLQNPEIKEKGDMFYLHIKGITQGDEYKFTAKSTEDLMLHVTHVLHNHWVMKRKDKLIWRTKEAKKFIVGIWYRTTVTPIMPPVQYVHIAVPTSPSVTKPIAQLEDKEYLNALIEVAVEENLQKRKLII